MAHVEALLSGGVTHAVRLQLPRVPSGPKARWGLWGLWLAARSAAGYRCAASRTPYPEGASTARVVSARSVPGWGRAVMRDTTGRRGRLGGYTGVRARAVSSHRVASHLTARREQTRWHFILQLKAGTFSPPNKQPPMLVGAASFAEETRPSSLSVTLAQV